MANTAKKGTTVNQAADPKAKKVDDKKPKVTDPKAADSKIKVEEQKKKVEEQKKKDEESKKKAEELKKKEEEQKKKIEEQKKKVEEPKKKIEEPKKKIEEPKKKIEEPKKKVEEPKKADDHKAAKPVDPKAAKPVDPKAKVAPVHTKEDETMARTSEKQALAQKMLDQVIDEQATTVIKATLNSKRSLADHDIPEGGIPSFESARQAQPPVTIGRALTEASQPYPQVPDHEKQEKQRNSIHDARKEKETKRTGVFGYFSNFMGTTDKADLKKSRTEIAREKLAMLQDKASNKVDDSEAGMRKVFEKFDEDHSGELDEKEMRKAFTLLGMDTTPEEVKKICTEADSDYDGMIDFREFKKIFKTLIAQKEPEEKKEVKPVVAKELAKSQVVPEKKGSVVIKKAEEKVGLDSKIENNAQSVKQSVKSKKNVKGGKVESGLVDDAFKKKLNDMASKETKNYINGKSGELSLTERQLEARHDSCEAENHNLELQNATARSRNALELEKIRELENENAPWTHNDPYSSLGQPKGPPRCKVEISKDLHDTFDQIYKRLDRAVPDGVKTGLRQGRLDHNDEKETITLSPYTTQNYGFNQYQAPTQLPQQTYVEPTYVAPQAPVYTVPVSVPQTTFTYTAPMPTYSNPQDLGTYNTTYGAGGTINGYTTQNPAPKMTPSFSETKGNTLENRNYYNAPVDYNPSQLEFSGVKKTKAGNFYDYQNQI